MRVWHKIGATLEMIKWEHSIFALPFALTAAMLAASGWPRVYQIFWIVVLHGSRAIRGNGIQPLGRRRTRYKEPSD